MRLTVFRHDGIYPLAEVEALLHHPQAVGLGGVFNPYAGITDINRWRGELLGSEEEPVVTRVQRASHKSYHALVRGEATDVGGQGRRQGCEQASHLRARLTPCQLVLIFRLRDGTLMHQSAIPVIHTYVCTVDIVDLESLYVLTGVGCAGAHRDGLAYGVHPAAFWKLAGSRLRHQILDVIIQDGPVVGTHLPGLVVRPRIVLHFVRIRRGVGRDEHVDTALRRVLHAPDVGYLFGTEWLLRLRLVDLAIRLDMQVVRRVGVEGARLAGVISCVLLSRVF